MHHGKCLFCFLSVVLILFLALASPGVAAEALSTHLPDGAKARLGRGEVRSVQFSPDGVHLAVGTDLGVWLYEAEPHKLLYLLTGHMHLIHSLAFSPDGQILASGGWDSTIRLWDVVTGDLRHTLSHPDAYHQIWPHGYYHTNSIDSMAFSPDGQTLARGYAEGTVRLWDTATGTLRQEIDFGFYESLAFSPDGQILASGGTDGVHLRDVATGTLRHIIDHGLAVFSVAFSPDGQTLASGDKGGNIHVTDVATGIRQYTIPDIGGWVNGLAFSPDGQTLTSNEAGGIVLRDTATGKLRRTLEHVGRLYTFSPDGQTLVTNKGGVSLWDTTTGELQHVLDDHATGSLDSVAFSPDGQTLVTGDSFWRTIYLWDPATGKPRYTLDNQTTATANCVAFAPDSQTLATGSSHPGTVHLWNVATGKIRHRLYSLGTYCVAFRPDGQILASSEAGGRVHLWDVATGKLHHTLEVIRRIRSNASPSVPTAKPWSLATATREPCICGMWPRVNSATRWTTRRTGATASPSVPIAKPWPSVIPTGMFACGIQPQVPSSTS